MYYSSRPTWHHTLAEELYSSTFVSTNQRPSLPVSTNQSSGISYELRVTSQIGYWNKNGLTSKWLLAQVATFLIFDNRQWISVIEWHKLKWTIVRNQGCLGSWSTEHLWMYVQICFHQNLKWLLDSAWSCSWLDVGCGWVRHCRSLHLKP